MMRKDVKMGRCVILSVLLAVSLLLLLAGKTAKVYVTGTLNDAGLRNAYVARLMDCVYDNLGSNSVDKLEQIQENLEARPEISSITQKYTDAFVEGIWENKAFDEISVDISSEVDGLLNYVVDEIEENVPFASVVDTLLRQLVQSSEEAATKAVNTYAYGIYNEINEKYAPMVKAYYVITSDVFLGIMYALVVLLAIALIASTPLRVTKIAVPVVGVLVGIIYYIAANLLAGRVVMTVSNRMLGRTVTLDTSRSITLLAGLFAVTVVAAVILFIADAVTGKKKKDTNAGDIA